MALTYPQRGFAGAAVAGTIASPGLTAVDGAGVTFTSSTTLTGWTEIANGSWSGDNICVTFGYGTASEEKILCTFNSATNTFTIVSRAYDGTTAVAHTTGSLFINTFTATEAAELNAVTQSMKGLLLTDGSAPLPADISTSSAARGSSTKPAAADHTHKITTSTLNSWLTSSASGQLPAGVSLYPSSIGAGALPSNVTVPYASITGAPVPISATGANGVNATVTAATGATPVLSAAVNPTGSFTNYTWSASVGLASAPTATCDINFVLLQRLSGGTTWTAVNSVTPGSVLNATNDYRTIATSGSWSSSGATDSEFQLAIFNSATCSWTAARIRLTVVGLS